MNRAVQGEPALDVVTIQTLPDGMDNLDGILTALVRNVSADEVAESCRHREAFKRRTGGPAAKVRSALLRLRRRVD
jgi:hypothetical protein